MTFNNKVIIITGGTGSFGQKMAHHILNKYKPKKLIIFSRDELKQHNMRLIFKNNNKLRFFIGDVRDKERLKFAFRECDIVIHAAALKQVPAAEYNPFEYIKTNIHGAQNIIEASLESNVQKVIALSTDKACSPINLYGATKLCSDKLFIAAQSMVGKKNIKFSIVRYGNVFGSRGSVLPIFLNKIKDGIFPITHKDMTRFMITLEEAIQFVVKCSVVMRGGEIFVPKLPSFKITDIAKALHKKPKFKIIGIRPGEKMHEELIHRHEARETFDLQKMYIIKSQNYEDVKSKYSNNEFKKCREDFSFNSGDNKSFLNLKQLKKLINNKY